MSSFQRLAGLSISCVLASGSCTPRAVTTDTGPLLDTRPVPFEPTDASVAPAGRLEVRLAHLSPAAPNLTICLSTIAGTGAPETTGRILGAPDPAAGLDGTLPYPGVSPYIPLPHYATPGFGYVVRLYDRAALPFVLGGACPPAGASPAPLFSATLETAPLVAGGAGRATIAAIGVVPGTPTACMGGCPEPRLLVFGDDPTPAAGAARIRLVHAIPNVPVPIEVCLDPDQRVVTMTNGPMPAVRVLPEASDTDGMRFGEVSAFIDAPPLRDAGALTVHAVQMGVPSCAPPTTILGPIPIPLPVPDTSPPDVARVFDVGDVITAFAFGRAGTPCTDDTACIAALGGRCTPRGCVDALSPSVLPWQDVMGPTP